MIKHYPKSICNSCAKAKSTKIPRLAKNRKTITIKIGDPQIFDAGTISIDMTGPYVIETWNTKHKFSLTAMQMDSKRTYVYS